MGAYCAKEHLIMHPAPTPSTTRVLGCVLSRANERFAESSLCYTRLHLAVPVSESTRIWRPPQNLQVSLRHDSRKVCQPHTAFRLVRLYAIFGPLSNGSL